MTAWHMKDAVHLDARGVSFASLTTGGYWRADADGNWTWGRDEPPRSAVDASRRGPCRHPRPDRRPALTSPPAQKSRAPPGGGARLVRSGAQAR